MPETVEGLAIGEPIRETKIPEKNALEYLDWMFYTIGAITKPSKTHKLERPLSLRTERVEILEKFKHSPSIEEKRSLLAEARARDGIARQYLTQSEIKVDVKGAGEQMSRYVILSPPTERNTKPSEPPVVIIPGASNDIDCVGTLARELPLRGRTTIILGYPESYMGKVTPQFAEMVNKAATYEPHADFYKTAINKLIMEGEFELWGYSNGGPIVELMLNDENFRSRVRNAVIACPASSVNQNMREFIVGIMKETYAFAQKYKILPKYTLSIGSKKVEDKKHATLRTKVFNGLIDRVLISMDLWKKARVKEGGKIIVISGTKDEVTKSHKFFNRTTESLLRQTNPQLRILEIDGSHADVLINPFPIIKDIQKIIESG